MIVSKINCIMTQNLSAVPCTSGRAVPELKITRLTKTKKNGNTLKNILILSPLDNNPPPQKKKKGTDQISQLV